MRISSIDVYLQLCEDHLDASNARSTDIESCLVQYLLTRICAEYETLIVVLVQRRCSRMRDAYLRNFAYRGAKEACKYFNISDIKGILGRFGDDYKKTFGDRVVNTPAHIAWDNI